MILRGLASLILVALFALNFMMPNTSMGLRGAENSVRADLASNLLIGETLPPLELLGLDGRKFTREDLQGHRVLLTFERSVDW